MEDEKDVIKEKAVTITVRKDRLKFIEDKAEELSTDLNNISSDFLLFTLFNKALLEYKLLYPFKTNEDLVNEYLALADLETYKENTSVISTKTANTISNYKLDSEETDSVTIKRIIEENKSLKKTNILLSSIASDLAEEEIPLNESTVNAYEIIIRQVLNSFGTEKRRVIRLKQIFNDNRNYCVEELLKAIDLIKNVDYAKEKVPDSLIDFEAYIKVNNS